MLTIEDIENRFRGYIPHPQDISGNYAVLAPLVERDGQLQLLFEVRAGSLKSHASEVCFPGGRMEQGETPQTCALRETWEELGIPASAIRIISPLDYVAHHTNIMIYPLLAVVEEQALASMLLNPDEVSDTFLVPLRFFQEHPPTAYEYKLVPDEVDDFPYEYVGCRGPYKLRGSQVMVPIYDKYCDYAVWGLTGRIVHHLMCKLDEAACAEMGECL